MRERHASSLTCVRVTDVRARATFAEILNTKMSVTFLICYLRTSTEEARITHCKHYIGTFQTHVKVLDATLAGR